MNRAATGGTSRARASPSAWCLVCESTPRKTQNQSVGHGLQGLEEIRLEALRRHGHEELRCLPRVLSNKKECLAPENTLHTGVGL